LNFRRPRVSFSTFCKKEAKPLPEIYPFTAIRFADAAALSDLIAPPYDVLDDAGKAALEKKNPHNIVKIDLPHMPPKTVGPDSAYESANRTLRAWLAEGVLVKDARPAFYAYAQTYAARGKTYCRRGFFARVKLSPFGQGQVVPHEKTYPEAIQDRLKLTRATAVQLSPVFGLFSDPQAEVTGRLFAGLKAAEFTATLDGVKNEMWTITDPQKIREITALMVPRPVYIADGHHRYTMALQYHKGNPAADCALFALVAMQDPGLIILPTHRIIGGVPNLSIADLRTKLSTNATVTEISGDLINYTDQILPTRPVGVFGLYDGRTKKLYELVVTNPDTLKWLEPDKSDAWRSLDVAVLQRYLLDEVISPDGTATRAYTAYADQVAAMTDGIQRQIAILLRPTPLSALEELGKFNEVMPQKSTYFYPKLATGMVINPLEF
jgi:uncharacterized protein (DUF1015 family)